MVEVAGDFQLGEGQATAVTFTRRFYRGSSRTGTARFLAFAFAVYFTVGVLGGRLTGRDPAGQIAFELTLGLFAVTPVVMLYLRWRKRTLKRLWIERGVQDPLPMRFQVGDESLRVIEPHQETRLAWAGVSELAPATRHWIVIGPLTGHCVPRRFFADHAAERAFIAAVVGRLGPQARARSPEAVAFARGARP